MMHNIFCHGLTAHKFNKWKIVEEGSEDMKVSSIEHATHTKKHWIKQIRACQWCGYSEVNVQIKFT